MRGRGLSSVSVVFAASPLKPTAGLRLNPESPRKETLLGPPGPAQGAGGSYWCQVRLSIWWTFESRWMLCR